MKKNYQPKLPFFAFIILMLSTSADAQMITGVWKGKINRQKAEVKIVLNGDSLTGTAYYYESAAVYRRYSIRGYFDVNTNEAVWWDDQLIDERTGKLSTPGKVPLLSRADFNCPGSGKMMLDGKTSKREQENPNGDLHLDKTTETIFNDEWDNIIDNYLAGGNDPDIIDSVSSIGGRTHAQEYPASPVIARPTPEKPVAIKQLPKEDPKPIVKQPEPIKQQTVEEKYASRKKTFTKEIVVTGDSIELRFYDNAEVDGDSISLFLNDRLIFEHIRLTEQAYVIKLAVTDLNASNELTMVAENLGSIPPNTSYMVVLVGENRYDARLESTEGASAMVRFVKKPETHLR